MPTKQDDVARTEWTEAAVGAVVAPTERRVWLVQVDMRSGDSQDMWPVSCPEMAGNIRCATKRRLIVQEDCMFFLQYMLALSLLGVR